MTATFFAPLFASRRPLPPCIDWVPPVIGYDTGLVPSIGPPDPAPPSHGMPAASRIGSSAGACELAGPTTATTPSLTAVRAQAAPVLALKASLQYCTSIWRP